MAPKAQEKRTTIAAPYIAQVAPGLLGSDGTWSNFYLSVGTPPQGFRVLPATVDSIVNVPLTDGCQGILKDLPNCGSLRGVNDSSSRGFSTSGGSSTFNSYGNANLFPNQNIFTTEGGIVFGDTVTLPGTNGNPNVTIKNQIIGGEVQTKFWLGSLGLGNNRVQYANSPNQGSFLSYLKNQSVIPSLSYAYHAGQSYAQTPGSLIIGGYDANKVSGSVVSTSVTNSNGKQLLNVGVQNIYASNGLDGAVQVTALSDSITASIDSSIAQLVLPGAVCDVLAKSFGLDDYDSVRQLYTVSSSALASMQKKDDAKATPALTMRIGDSSSGYTNIVLSYKALVMAANIPVFNYSTNYFPLRRATDPSQYVLGRTLLQEAYLVVDWERQNFTIGPVMKSTTPDVVAITVPTSAPAATSSAAANVDSGSSSSSGIGAGAIAGIVVVVILLIAAVAGFFLFRRHKRKTNKNFRLSTMSWYTPDAPPPPYATEPEYYGADKAENEVAEAKSPNAQLSELYGSTQGPSELTSDNVARLERIAAERSELMSTPVAELGSSDAPKSELDGSSVRARDSMQSGVGTVRSSVVSPRRNSTIAERTKSPISPVFELA